MGTYTLHELLLKMGAPEVEGRGWVHWHYFDKTRRTIAGKAEIRLEDGGDRLVAELTHTRENHTDEDGKLHALYTETFHMKAARAGGNKYRVTDIGFDGEKFRNPPRAMAELGLSLFHARALDISMAMIEQSFSQDMDIPEPAAPANIARPSAVIIPFPKQRARARLGA
jgi:hypothetical protein